MVHAGRLRRFYGLNPQAGFRLDTAYWCTRDLAFPTYVAMAAQDAYRMAGITKPEDEIDVWEPYDPFDYKALHHMNALLQDRSGRKTKDLLFSGAFERDGSHPMCPSGGLLGVVAAWAAPVLGIVVVATGPAAINPSNACPIKLASMGVPEFGLFHAQCSALR